MTAVQGMVPQGRDATPRAKSNGTRGVGRLVAVLAVLAMVVLPAVPRASGYTLLPLGDSITHGCGSDTVFPAKADCGVDDGGYRTHLYALLVAAGHTVTMVGSAVNGPASAPAAALSNEGHPGARTFQLVGNCTSPLSPLPPPTHAHNTPTLRPLLHHLLSQVLLWHARLAPTFTVHTQLPLSPLPSPPHHHHPPKRHRAGSWRRQHQRGVPACAG